ncbi:MAG: hypothetical protein LC650_01185 [Actinobacteria bacterium]|nr:hypothetical protein [Actinomycetota bacterium]
MYAMLGATSAAVFISTCVVAVAFAVTHASGARPFHVERGAVFTALALAYLGVLASRQQTGLNLLELVHVHEGTAARSVIALVYNVLWVLAVFVTLIGFLWSPSRDTPMLWTAASTLAIVLALVPIETDLATDSGWILGLRFNAAFLVYLAVSLADAAYLLEYTLFRNRKGEAREVNNRSSAVDVPFVRTLSWIALTLWPIFANVLALVASIALVGLLFYVVYIRWHFARHAYRCVHSRKRFHLQNHWARPGHVKLRWSVESLERMPKEKLVDVVTDLMERGGGGENHRYANTALPSSYTRNKGRPRASVRSVLPDD